MEEDQGKWWQASKAKCHTQPVEWQERTTMSVVGKPAEHSITYLLSNDMERATRSVVGKPVWHSFTHILSNGRK